MGLICAIYPSTYLDRMCCNQGLYRRQVDVFPVLVVGRSKRLTAVLLTRNGSVQEKAQGGRRRNGSRHGFKSYKYSVDHRDATRDKETGQALCLPLVSQNGTSQGRNSGFLVLRSSMVRSSRVDGRGGSLPQYISQTTYTTDRGLPSLGSTILQYGRCPPFPDKRY